jgi:spermidine synthase
MSGVEDPAPVIRDAPGRTLRLLPDLDRGGARLLTVNGAPQSYVDPADPEYLEFEYVRRLAHALDLTEPAGPLDVLHLGGGALTLPRYLAATRPGSRQRVAESDEELRELVACHLPLPSGSGIRVETRDARGMVEEAAADSADVVVADVFDGDRVPAHLTTLEYARSVVRVLRPGGLYAANLADAAPFGFLASQLATWRAAAGHVCVLAEPAVLRGRRYGNTVLLASSAPLPLAGLARRLAADPFPARVAHGDWTAALTDGVAPVHDGEAVPSPAPPEGAFTVG